MPRNNSDHWISDPEYVNLIQFLIEKTKNVKTPLKIAHLAEELKKKSLYSGTINSLKHRIRSFRPKIHKLEHVDAETRMKMIYVLSVPVEIDFLKELEEEANITLDDNHRIIEYKRKGGGLELKGKHVSTKNDAIRENGKMMKFLAETSKKFNSPINDYTIVRKFRRMTRSLDHLGDLRKKYQRMKKSIYDCEEFDEATKIRMIFVSGARLHEIDLENIRNNATIEVDEQNRITKYKAKDGSLEFISDHSGITKQGLSTYRNEIKNYFEGMRHDDIDTDKQFETEMENLIKFICKACKNIDSPLNIHQLMKGFDSHCGSVTSMKTHYKRIRAYRQEIQSIQNMDKETKVKQLFGLSAPLTSACLEELQEDARIEVDHQKRIRKYTSNDGKLNLEGDHKKYSKQKLWFAKNKERNGIQKTDDSEDNESDESDDDEEASSDDESSEESDSEFVTDEEEKGLEQSSSSSKPSSTDKRKHLDRSADLNSKTKKSDEKGRSSAFYRPRQSAVQTTLRINEKSDKQTNLDERLDLEAPVNNSNESNDIQEPVNVTTRSGRVSKKRFSDANFFQDLDTPIFTTTPTSNKRKITNDKTPPSLSKRAARRVSSPIHSNRPEEIDEPNYPLYDTPQNDSGSNHISQRKVKLEPFNGEIVDREGPNAIEEDDDIQVIRMPVVPKKEANDVEIIQFPKEEQIMETVPVEVKTENPVEEKSEYITTKHKYSYTSHLKFLEAIQSLIIALDTPTLSKLKRQVDKKIDEIDKEKEIPNNEVIVAMEVCIVKMSNHSITSLLPDNKSISLRDFFCYLKVAILCLKLNDFGSLVDKLKKEIEKCSSQSARIPVEKVESAIQTTMNVIGI